MAAVAVLLAGALAVAGCSAASFSGTDGDPSKATLGVMYSTDRGNKTAIQWLDAEHNVVGTSRLPYSQAGASFENANVQDGNIYLTPIGASGECNEQRVVVVRPASGDAQELTLESQNHVASDVEGNLWAISSNGNGMGRIDLVDLDTREVRSCESDKLWDAGVMQVALVNGRVFGVGSGDDSSSIYEIDMANGSPQLVFNCPDDPQAHVPSYLSKHGSDLVFISNAKLVKLDTASRKAQYVGLSREDCEIVNVQGGIVWVAYTDPHDDTYESVVEARDYQTGTILGSASFDGGILQVEPARDAVYVVGYDAISQYALDSDGLTFASSIEPDPQYRDFYVSGVFAL